MGLPQEDLLEIEDIAARWGKEKAYVRTKVRQCRFQRVIIEKVSGRNNRWTAHYYFNREIWPFKETDGPSPITQNGPSGADIHYLLLPDPKKPKEPNIFPNDRWLEDAETIFVPLKAVEAFEEESGIAFNSSAASPIDLSKLLDRGNMSEALRIAIEANIHLYTQKNLLQHRGDREQIRAWIEQRYPHLSKNLLDHIVSVVNRRKGGSPPVLLK